MPPVTVDADLDFSLALPGPDGRPGAQVTGHLRGHGQHLRLEVSDARPFAGRGNAGAVRGLANGLAARGLTLTVVSPQGPLVTLGTRAGWLQRRVTGSRHLRVVGWRAALAALRGAGSAGEDALVAPPRTLWPLAPTLRRRRGVTTTHDPDRGGDPRLIEPPREDWWPGDTQAVHHLTREVTSIGSSEECDIVVPGLDSWTAEVRHDELDEYVVVRLGSPGSVRVNGEPVSSKLVRTGSRLTLCDHYTLTFVRDEYADHGRPYGGRIGGELGHQRSQPPQGRIYGGSVDRGSP